MNEPGEEIRRCFAQLDLLSIDFIDEENRILRHEQFAVLESKLLGENRRRTKKIVQLHQLQRFVFHRK